MAIVNPAQVKPYAEIPANERELAENLVFNRSEAALADLIATLTRLSPATMSNLAKPTHLKD